MEPSAWQMALNKQENVLVYYIEYVHHHEW